MIIGIDSSSRLAQLSVFDSPLPGFALLVHHASIIPSVGNFGSSFSSQWYGHMPSRSSLPFALATYAMPPIEFVVLEDVDHDRVVEDTGALFICICIC
jgi:hypothetical protein